MKPSVFLAVGIFSGMLTACGGGGNDPKVFGVLENRIEFIRLQDDKVISVSGAPTVAPLFSLMRPSENRWPHVKLRINERNVIGFVDTGGPNYAFMDDDSARALGLNTEHLIGTFRTDGSGGWCPGAPGDFINYSLYQADLEIGGLTIRNGYILVRHDDDNNLFTPLIGNEISSRFTMQWPYSPSSLSGESVDLRGGESAIIDYSGDNLPFVSGAVLVNGVETDDENGPIRFLLDTGFQHAHANLNLDSQEDAKIATGVPAGSTDAAGRRCFYYAGSPVTLALPSLSVSITVAQSPAPNGSGIVITQRRNDINAFGTDFFRDGVQLLSAPGPNAHNSADTSGWRMSYEARDAPADLFFAEPRAAKEMTKSPTAFTQEIPIAAAVFRRQPFARAACYNRAS